MANKLSPPKKQVKQKRFDILVYADFNCTTGFGNVTKELVDYWKTKITDNINIHIFAINDQSKKAYSYCKGVKVYPANVMPYASNDLMQRAAFLSLVQSVDYNVIYMLNDLEVVGTFIKDLELINADKKKLKRLQYKTILYFPIDSLPRKENLQFLSKLDEIVTYTNYAKTVIDDYAPKEVSEKIHVIPHGVDTKTFRRLGRETIAFQKKKEAKFGKNKFVIGTVNRNSARKDLATLVLAFAELKKDFQNLTQIQESLVLYMHCNPTDPAGVNLKYLAITQGLVEGKDIFFPDNFSENQGVSPQELNELYNFMDVFVTTSTAEGWGLTVTEAMSAETLVVCPMHTSLVELAFGLETDCKPIFKAICINNLENCVFVGDGDKVRYKTPTAVLTSKLHDSISLDENQKPKIIANAKNSLQQYNWQESAEKFWQLISKYLK